jgi:hypothetical protein
MWLEEASQLMLVASVVVGSIVACKLTNRTEYGGKTARTQPYYIYTSHQVHNSERLEKTRYRINNLWFRKLQKHETSNALERFFFVPRELET